MKVEKISENKVKITLTLDELDLRDISLKDIENNSSLARELFIDLLEETNLADEFAESDTQLFIEASSDNENLFVVTITNFYKTFSIISEFCSEYYSYEMFNTYVKEKSQLVIANFALQKLINKVIKNTNK